MSHYDDVVKFSKEIKSLKEQRDELLNRIETIKMQRYELMGVIADIDNGSEFDSVCYNTVSRVINTLKDG